MSTNRRSVSIVKSTLIDEAPTFVLEEMLFSFFCNPPMAKANLEILRIYPYIHHQEQMPEDVCHRVSCAISLFQPIALDGRVRDDFLRVLTASTKGHLVRTSQLVSSDELAEFRVHRNIDCLTKEDSLTFYNSTYKTHLFSDSVSEITLYNLLPDGIRDGSCIYMFQNSKLLTASPRWKHQCTRRRLWLEREVSDPAPPVDSGPTVSHARNGSFSPHQFRSPDFIFNLPKEYGYADRNHVMPLHYHQFVCPCSLPLYLIIDLFTI
ncbi:hypothetical protein FCM35_KLT03707 [Carex littledalei]|uniref:Uncharacterized protein n=1 Tax=Carex littledalei TaxID=544730 RepID=A0A833R6B7_9POAL|nr:hypothetical protein FCM35_KLT03707 [Carex littledalei]